MAAMTTPARIYLSPPHMSGAELGLLIDAFESNWIAPLGPHVDGFEREFAERVGTQHAVALSSGTAALHMALRALGMQRGDEVICSTLTFAASANPIVYEGGHPVFVDCDDTWTMDPALLETELARCAARGALPRAVIVVDLYGQVADYERIGAVCERYGVPIIEDAAEALGSTRKGRAAGTFGRASVFSFNGNKIITTSGGGMLLSDDEALAASVRSLAQQARDPAPHYEHTRIGFNYRLSNLLAAVGRGQLKVLDDRVRARRDNFDFYRAALQSVPGITMMPEAPDTEGNRWLTCLLIDPDAFGATREDVRVHLEACAIESRPTWKPMHRQPVFAGCRAVGGAQADAIFERGLCLPSGSSLTARDRERVVAELLAAAPSRARA
jgi:pyridoxal phosphate-dependent aminotransferase EpsN